MNTPSDIVIVPTNIDPTNAELDAVVLGVIAAAPQAMRAKEILSAIGRAFKREREMDLYRPLDKSLQRLRKQGKIKTAHRRWTLTPRAAS